EDDLGHGCEIFIEQRDQFHRRRAFGECGEIAYVAKEDSELALLAGKIHVVDVFEYVIDELRGDVAVEGAARASQLTSSGGVPNGPAGDVRNGQSAEG